MVSIEAYIRVSVITTFTSQSTCTNLISRQSADFRGREGQVEGRNGKQILARTLCRNYSSRKANFSNMLFDKDLNCLMTSSPMKVYKILRWYIISALWLINGRSDGFFLKKSFNLSKLLWKLMVGKTSPQSNIFSKRHIELYCWWSWRVVWSIVCPTSLWYQYTSPKVHGYCRHMR